MVVALVLLGLINICYGVSVMLLNSGTGFFVVWYAIGAAWLGLAVALHTGLWASLPALVKRIAAVLLVGVLAALVLSWGLIATEFKAQGEDDLDYLIVLGAQIYSDGSPSPSLRYRLDAALAYLEQNPDTRVIVSGGKGPNEPYAEARGMAAYLMNHGVARERILLESRSESTLQNITFSMALMDSRESSVGIVTNDFHVYRAVHTARKAGLAHACGIAGYSTPLYLPNNLLRESLGLAKDFAVGNI